MVGSSKILTVSYGTFSCTLEGFDDSFSTMKAIAEYFRDLAADDRYFGAEPPTPDADMLARIAEKEVSRRVEARMDDGGIVLKTGSALAAVGLAQPEAETPEAAEVSPAPEPAPQPVEEAKNFVAETVEAEAEPEAAAAEVVAEVQDTAPVMPPVAEAPAPAAAFEPGSLTPTDEFEDEDEPQDVGQTNFAPTPADTPAHLDADSVAAKLQRIRAVVGRTGAAAPLDGSDTPQSLFAQPEEQIEDAPVDLDEYLTDAAAEDVTENADIPAADVAEDVASDEVEAAADDTADATEAELAPEAELDDDSIEVAEDDIATLEDEVASDAPAEDTIEDVAEDAPEEATLDAASLGILNDAIAAETATEEAEVEQTETPDAVEAAEVELADTDEDNVEEDNVEPETAESEADEDDDETPAPVRARVIRMRRSAVDAAVAAGTFEDENDTELADLQDRLAEAEELDSYGEPEVEDDGAMLDDLGASAEAEVEAEDAADLARLDGADESDVADDETEQSSLSPDAEAELQAELAALVGGMETEDDAVVTDETLNIEAEDELIDDMAAMVEDDIQAELEDVALDTDAPNLEIESEDVAEFEAEVAEDAVADEAPEETDAGPLRPRRVRMPGSIDEDDASMERIMSQTEAQMSAPDSSRRRESIEQLKAAVAATEADREMGDEAKEETDSAEDTFRDDLRQVVRPTRPIRPQRPTERGERTERPAPAPLKLVASQRVDLPSEDDRSEAAEAPRSPVMPVRPRRVMKTDEPDVAPEQTSADAPSGGFAAFAEEMGAHELSDLLEAAAAYTSFVEGSEDFSRPQLMNKIKETSDTEYSREEGLRSFGTLLRQGRIMKVRNGRFQVNDETRFNPERRAG